MAEGGREDSRAFRGMERVRDLLQATEDFRMREERGQGSPSPPSMTQRGRAGAPRNNQNNSGEKDGRGDNM